MTNPIRILKVYPRSFRVNLYSEEPFRMIGIIDADIRYHYGIERVTLAFYRSSGTYSGKIKGVWYPIVGIKMQDGKFTEFTRFLNIVLSNCTREGEAGEGWLAKSLFFSKRRPEENMTRGFSNGRHHKRLLDIGLSLRDLYESGLYYKMEKLDTKMLNGILCANRIYKNNEHTQRENFERLVEDIYMEDFI